MSRPECKAYQMSDQKCCDRCGLVWDMNDPEPPTCLTDTQIVNNNLLKASKRFRDAMPTVKQAAEGLRNAFKTTSEQMEINRRGMAKLRESMKK